MKIPEAIEVSKAGAIILEVEHDKRFADAIRLGIEALKVIKKWREQHRDLGFLLMPGETEE